MSWLDRINNIKLKVVTGDGSEFTPLYKNASRNRDMNASVFNFNEIEGSLVRRGKASSMVYPFEFHFTGDDHIEESERFNKASLDTRPWTMTHTVYGDILVQPAKLNFDDSKQNDTIVTGELFETIRDSFPDSSIDVKSAVLKAVEISIDNMVENFGTIEAVTPALVSKAAITTNQITQKYKLAAITDIDLQTVQNKSNEALAALNNITQDPLTYMRKLAELARTPAKFYARVQDRIVTLDEAYQDYKLAIGAESTVQNKLLFESVTGVLISAIAETSVVETQEIADDQFIEDNTIVDYSTRSDVLNVADSVKNSLDDYTNTLGSFQSDVDATPDSYTPKQKSLNSAKDAVNKSTGQLLQIAVQTKQERKYTIQYPIGLVMLVHRLLGTTDDQTIRDFAENNQITMDEWLQLPPSREVIYFL